VGWVRPCLRRGALLALFERAEPRCELRLVGEEPPGVDEAQAAALQLRALFWDLRRFDNIFFRKMERVVGRWDEAKEHEFVEVPNFNMLSQVELCFICPQFQFFSAKSRSIPAGCCLRAMRRLTLVWYVFSLFFLR
jgi:hypothetical protein